VVVESHDDFPGVEISIAGGVGEKVRATCPPIVPLPYRVLNTTPLFPGPSLRLTSYLYTKYTSSYHLWLPPGIPFGLRR